MSHIEYGYGVFPGGDPRLFEPDVDCCTPEEIQSHHVACQSWQKGERAQQSPDCVVFPGGIRTHFAGFGIGSYRFDCDCDEPPE